MKKQFIFSAIACIFMLSLQVFAQDFEVPEDFVLRSGDDYVKYEKDIIVCADWLENSPLDKDTAKRKDANSFLMRWATGNSKIKMTMDRDILVKYFKGNPQFQIIFIAGWVRYALKNDYSDDQKLGQFEGFKSVINVYKRGIAIQKSNEMDDLVKLSDDGKLKDWLEENVK